MEKVFPSFKNKDGVPLADLLHYTRGSTLQSLIGRLQLHTIEQNIEQTSSN